MARSTVRVLKAVLALLVLGMLVVQLFFLPLLSWEIADDNPELAYLRWPTLIVAMVVVLCAELVVVAIWKLLGMVSRDAIFSEAAFTWVDVIIYATVAATALVAAVFAYYTAVQLNPFALALMEFVLIATGAALALLMLVLRSLLRKATSLQADMAEVI